MKQEEQKKDKKEAETTAKIDDFLRVIREETDISKLTTDEKIELIDLIEYTIMQAAPQEFWAFCLYWDYEFYTTRQSALIEMSGIFEDLYIDKLDEAYMSIAPSSGKTYMSLLFQAWILGKDTLETIMYNSYSTDKATDESKALKEMIADPRFSRIFGDKTSKRGQSQARLWKLHGAKTTTFFVGAPKGQGTGYHARWIIADDLVKNIFDGLNAELLDRIYLWWLSGPETRKEKVKGKTAKVIMIGTRWNDMDPIGKKKMMYTEMLHHKKVISDQLEIWHLRDGRKVAMLSIKALKKDGTSYCEEIYTTKQLQSIQKEYDELLFSALFQQEPANAKGRLFKPMELNRFKMSEYMRDKRGFLIADLVLGRVDLADSGKDKTVSVMGYMVGEEVFITDIVFTDDDLEASTPQIVAQIKNQPKISQFRVEANFEGKTTAANLRRLTGISSKKKIEAIPTTKNKEAKIILKSGYIKRHFYFLDITEYLPGSDYDKAMKQLYKYEKMKTKQADDFPDVLASLCIDIDELQNKSNKKISIYLGN